MKRSQVPPREEDGEYKELKELYNLIITNTDNDSEKKRVVVEKYNEFRKKKETIDEAEEIFAKGKFFATSSDLG